MAQLINIKEVVIGPKYLVAQVALSEECPVMTNEDIEGTARVYNLMPHITEHVCMGDKGQTFKEAMPSTEIAHVLEHVTVELLAQTGLAGDISCGRTWAVKEQSRTYAVQLICTDDVLVCGALASAVWILQWAYTGGGEPVPDITGIVAGLHELVQAADGNASHDINTPNAEEVIEDNVDGSVDAQQEDINDGAPVVLTLEEVVEHESVGNLSQEKTQVNAVDAAEVVEEESR